ncbi:DUF4231 domain-containing protein [Halomonas sp. CKK8]|uniref:DUF4231 domain-containing protein n=1 Tax=Halomonas sp. CKK8 TaxID=3036127 RepID=UPI0024155588|nr:DUF4231 domain-containing protein [Halomonas sp. CKK8]WFM72507.1 DUF4231 domain-containing protein [Halomonas sp. CKK8]
MTLPTLQYPGLYEGADTGSNSAQRLFLWTIRIEYLLLFCVSVASALRGITGNNSVLITILLVFLAGLFVFKIVKKLEQNWYQCRALAESVKTSTWRFSMRAHPFQDASSIEIPKSELRNMLRDILKSNRHIAENLNNPESDQVTDSMLSIRKLSLNDRRDFYITNRIDNQRNWYAKKSADNKKAQRIWLFITISVYSLAAISVNSEHFGVVWAAYAFDPLIVVVTSAIGWIQMKRHGELVASYNLTAHEIGIIRSNSDDITSEEDLSEFVNEAELAFSREHTQWVARRDAV